jgi:hypothetical protein
MARIPRSGAVFGVLYEYDTGLENVLITRGA